jgi:hypothetical protein
MGECKRERDRDEKRKKKQARTVGILHTHTAYSHDQRHIRSREYGTDSYRKEKHKQPTIIIIHYHLALVL